MGARHSGSLHGVLAGDSQAAFPLYISAELALDPAMPASPIDWTTWRGEMLATLMFVVCDGQVLLIEKKRGLGAGKINGPGGKIEPGETPLEAVIRETQEELCITPQTPRKLGELWFSMTTCPDILCHVFRAEGFTGSPTETDEAVPLWTPLDAIPYHRMWADDRHWLPLLLEQQTFRGRFVFDDESMLWSELETGLDFESQAF
jgi:8-oxo-dGTP diphosphatase